MANTQADTVAQDHIGGPSTKELAGTALLYQYTTGRKFQLEFTPDEVAFVLASDPKKEKHYLPYRARKIREDLYMVHWIIKANHIHVTLLLDFEQDHVHVSGLMPDGSEFFDIAKIEKKERPL